MRQYVVMVVDFISNGKPEANTYPATLEETETSLHNIRMNLDPNFYSAFIEEVTNVHV